MNSEKEYLHFRVLKKRKIASDELNRQGRLYLIIIAIGVKTITIGEGD